jgi:hypothetical protein
MSRLGRPLVAVLLEPPLRRLIWPILDAINLASRCLAADVYDAVLEAEREHAASSTREAVPVTEPGRDARVDEQVQRSIDVDVGRLGAEDVTVDELRVMVGEEAEGNPLDLVHPVGHRTDVRTAVKR